MGTFKQYYYFLTEDEELDRELRNKALDAYRNIHNTLKEAVDEGWIEGLFRRIDSGSFIFKNIENVIDSEYSDLWIIFTPQKKGSGNIRKGGFGFHTSGNPVIVLDILLDEYSLKYIDTRFAGAMKNFVHEFTHYLDWKRTGKKSEVTRSKASEASVDIISIEDYVNDPKEFNAYYQEIASEFQDTAERVMDKIEKQVGKENLEKFVNASFGKTLDEFIQRAFRKLPDFVRQNLNSKYRKKFRKRLAGFYNETIKPIIDEKL